MPISMEMGGLPEKKRKCDNTGIIHLFGYSMYETRMKYLLTLHNFRHGVSESPWTVVLFVPSYRSQRQSRRFDALARNGIWKQLNGLRKRAIAVVGHTPEQVTTDGHASYPRAVRAYIGRPRATSDQHIPQPSLRARSSWRPHSNIIPCTTLEISTQQLVSAGPLRNDGTIFFFAPTEKKRSHPQNSDEFSLRGLQH